MRQIELHPGLPDGRWACLRPLCGHDEAATDGSDDLAATRLVDRLLVAAPGTSVEPGRGWELSVTDRDRLLVALYEQLYGERIEGTVECPGCSASYEMAFGLDDLRHRLAPREGGPARGPDAERGYELPDGRRFRLPTPDDQRSVLGLDPAAAAEAILERCLLSGEVASDRAGLEAAIEELALTLDLDLEAACPECSQTQEVRFDLGRHLLGALAAERRWLAREVHSIATAYGWGLHEILGLTRDDRRAYVEIIEADRAAVAGS